MAGGAPSTTGCGGRVSSDHERRRPRLRLPGLFRARAAASSAVATGPPPSADCGVCVRSTRRRLGSVWVSACPSPIPGLQLIERDRCNISGCSKSAGELTHGETSQEMCVVDAWDPKLYGMETKEYDVKEEAATKERFEQWMKQYNRTYMTEEEKAFRYERFKIATRHVEDPNGFADWTADEYDKKYNNCNCIDVEQYNAEINAQIAEVGIDDHLGVTSISPERMECLKEAEERCRQARKCWGN